MWTYFNLWFNRITVAAFVNISRVWCIPVFATGKNERCLHQHIYPVVRHESLLRSVVWLEKTFLPYENRLKWRQSGASFLSSTTVQFSLRYSTSPRRFFLALWLVTMAVFLRAWSNHVLNYSLSFQQSFSSVMVGSWGIEPPHSTSSNHLIRGTYCCSAIVNIGSRCICHAFACFLVLKWFVSRT